MRQCWGLQVGPMHETAVMGKLINAALLSLMRRLWVYAVLPSSWVNSSAPLVCRHDRVTREVGRVGLVGRDRGRRGYWVALYLYIPQLVTWGPFGPHSGLMAVYFCSPGSSTTPFKVVVRPPNVYEEMCLFFFHQGFHNVRRMQGLVWGPNGPQC